MLSQVITYLKGSSFLHKAVLGPPIVRVVTCKKMEFCYVENYYFLRERLRLVKKLDPFREINL